VLISPAGLPLTKPIRYSLAQFILHASRGRYRWPEVVRSVRAALTAPRDALRLARAVHDADLSAEMSSVCGSDVETTVIGCSTDTLVTPGHCRRAAGLLGASYRELTLDGGHMWMLRAWPQLARILATA
jgi:hypothetical protein